MKHAKLCSGLAGGAFVAVSVLGLAPAANADGPAPRDPPAVSSGQARNDIGNYKPATAPTGGAGTSDTSSGMDTQDVVLGSLAGLVAVVGIAGTAVTLRQRRLTHHPA